MRRWYSRLSPAGRVWLWVVVVFFFVGGLFCTYVSFQPLPEASPGVSALPPLEQEMRAAWRKGFLFGVDLACNLGMVLLGLVALDLMYTFVTMRPGPLRRLADRCFGKGKDFAARK